MGPNEVPDAIQWHEGMLLAPQHYQQWSLRQEILLHSHLLTIAPFHWGVRRCPIKIDPGLLVRGTLRILELEAVMPDGLLVAHGFRENEELEVDLTPHTEGMKERPLLVHLAVPARKSGAVKGDLPRYLSVEGSPVSDENTGDNALQIPRLRPRLSLLVTESPPAKFVSFPLLELRYTNETFVVTDFVPPLMATSLRSPIGDMCLRITKRIREKAVFLSEQARSPSAKMGGAFLIDAKYTVHSLVAALPHFEAVLNTGVAHPYAVYLALCSLVGNLAALGESLIPPDLKPYDHNDLRSTFAPLLASANRMIEEGIPETYTSMAFNYEQGLFSLRFDGSWMNRRLILAVRGQQGMSERDVMAWVEGCLIGSRNKIQSLREKRILGLVRDRIEQDEELVPTRGVVLFNLRPDPAFLEPNEVLQIFQPSDRGSALRPAEIMLHVKNKP